MKPIDVLTGGEHSRLIKARKCTLCGEDALEFEDVLSEREYEISGACQACQDQLFEPDCDEDDGYALASAGRGTDEDYGSFGGEED